MDYLKISIKTSLNTQFQNYIFSKCKCLSIRPQNVVIDFSSPNIAKPFHPGHLRATLVGNFVSNINTLFGHNVYKINYLGDWGTQFGFLLYGLKQFGNDECHNKNSLKYFYEIYAKSTQTFNTDKDKIAIKEMLLHLENNDFHLKSKWNEIRNISIENLKLVYERLGIEFSSFEFESDFARTSKDLVKEIERKTNSILELDGAVFYIVDNEYKIPLLTKEGSSLYITRDVAAAISRFDLYKPDRIHYVVEDGQALHFQTLQRILTNLGYKINEFDQDKYPHDFHIKFGRVSKMSTRKGNVIFLDSVLDRAKETMLEKLNDEKKVTLTCTEHLENLAENLGKTIIFCEFLRSPRQNPFDFVWDRDNLGFRLQYCRVSLNSLERRCFDHSINPTMIDCFQFDSYDYFKNYPSAIQLVNHMAKWDNVLHRCYFESESCYLMTYITQMVGLVNNALRELPVINAPSRYDAEMRLKIFSVAKFILDINYRLLGFPEIQQI